MSALMVQNRRQQQQQILAQQQRSRRHPIPPGHGTFYFSSAIHIDNQISNESRKLASINFSFTGPAMTNNAVGLQVSDEKLTATVKGGALNTARMNMYDLPLRVLCLLRALSHLSPVARGPLAATGDAVPQ